MIHIRLVCVSYMESDVGIVNIDDDLHDQIRKASAVSCRSINAQAAFWIKVGMLCEMNSRGGGMVGRPVNSPADWAPGSGSPEQ